MAKKKEPRLLPCRCGSDRVTISQARTGRWIVLCLNPKCGHTFRDFGPKTRVIEAWNKEVTKK